MAYTEILTSVTITLTGAVQQLPSYGGGSVTIINDDGTNTNGTIWIGNSSSTVNIPIRAGQTLAVEVDDTSALYVNGTLNDVITLVIWRK